MPNRLIGLMLIGRLVAASAVAAPCDTPRPIQFLHGAIHSEVRGGIARGEISCLVFSARAGQRMLVSVSSIESNVVLQIYRPGWRITRQADEFSILGTALRGAGETQEASSWSGILPVTGTYLLILGTIRGGGGYRLEIEID